jgi:maltose O-acetyltransferase
MQIFKDKMGRELTLGEASPRIIDRIKNYLLDFELMLLRWVGHIPFHHLRRLVYRLAGMKIGKGSTIHMWANFFNPAGIEVGEDTIIGNHAFLDGRAPLKIGNHVDIASEVMIYNSEHDVHQENMRAIEEPVIIEDYAFIGPRVVILPGVKIGKGVVVAAAAVVTKDIPSGKIVGGVPAREIGERRIKKYSYRLGRARWFQ